MNKFAKRMLIAGLGTFLIAASSLIPVNNFSLGLLGSSLLPNAAVAQTATGGTIFRREGSVWRSFAGQAAFSVAIGGSNNTWIIGNNPVPGGFGIYRWNGSSWQGIDGGAVDIAVAPNGQPWVINDQGYIFRRVNGAWQVMPGRARDIDVGLDGSVWVLGTEPVAGGYGVYRWNGSGWQQIDGGAVRIAVAPNGQPWVVNNQGYIFRRVNGVWQHLTGLAKDIAIGHNGSVWVIGTNSVPGGFGIYRWNGSGWQPIDGGAVRIAVDNNGNPWVINNISPPPSGSYRTTIDQILNSFFSQTSNTNGQAWSNRSIQDKWDRIGGESAQFPSGGYTSGDLWQVDMPTGVYGVYQDLSTAMFGSVRTVTTGYAYDRGYYGAYGAHSAIDIGAANGTIIKSPVNGRVVDNRAQYRSNGAFNGYWIAIDELDSSGQRTGRRWWLGHLNTRSVSVGSTVVAGQTILGTVGQGHVHLGVVSSYATYTTSMYGNEVRNGSTSLGYANAVQDVLNRTMSPLQAYWKFRNGIRE